MAVAHGEKAPTEETAGNFDPTRVRDVLFTQSGSALTAYGRGKYPVYLGRSHRLVIAKEAEPNS